MPNNDIKFTVGGLDMKLPMYMCELIEDENGDLVLPLPSELCANLDWKVGDTVMWKVSDTGEISLIKV
jgi:hypothetical protein